MQLLNTLFLSEKEKIFNTKAMVIRYLQNICRSCKKTDKTKKQTEVASGLYWPCALCGCHGKHIQYTVLTVSEVGLITKTKTFPLNHSLACANYAVYAAITCIHSLCQGWAINFARGPFSEGCV